MSKIQIGKQATNAGEFIEGSSIFMDAEGHFVAGEFVETNIPNISKMYKVTKAFETFEIIESEESPSPQLIARYNVTEFDEGGDTALIFRVSGDVELTELVESITLDNDELDVSEIYDYGYIVTHEIGQHELIITLKEGVTEVESFFNFGGCHSLTSITIPSGVTSIGYGAFEDCTSLTSITIPNSVTSIGDHAFGDCSSLTSITIPNGVTSIGISTFRNCSVLTSIDIPSGVTGIYLSAFEGCSSLTSIAIPSGVTSIGGSAFRYCTGLTSITCLPTTPPELSDQESVFEDTNGCPIYVPSQSVDAYKNAEYWSYYEYRIQAIPNP